MSQSQIDGKKQVTENGTVGGESVAGCAGVGHIFPREIDAVADGDVDSGDGDAVESEASASRVLVNRREDPDTALQADTVTDTKEDGEDISVEESDAQDALSGGSSLIERIVGADTDCTTDADSRRDIRVAIDSEGCSGGARGSGE